jgi:threonine dehydrogenase-like Zn-dependent dehydrogenase
MNPAPQTFTALLQKQDGYTTNPEGHIQFESFDDYLEIGELPLPELTPGQVLVEMTLATINPSDLHFVKGEYGQPRQQGSASRI